MRFNKHLEDIKVYEAGKPIELVVRDFGIKQKDVIKLASNENPMGCSKKVKKKIAKSLHEISLYPDDSMFELKQGLSKRFGVGEKNIIIGAGSDQVIEFAVHAKLNEKTAILTAGITFAMYEIYAKQVGGKVIKTPSDIHDLDQFSELYEKHKREISIIFLCLPNNPLGECLDKKDVYDFLKTIDKDVLVVVDGAYQEYASYKDEKKKIEPQDLIKNFPNTIYLGTFSKAYGLGGMRLGYGIASEDIINVLHKLRPPFNITSLSLKAGIWALKDEDFIKSFVKQNFKELKKYEKFADKMGIKYIKSYTNFITLLLPRDKNSTSVSNSLLKKGIILRNLAPYGINAIRVSVGLKKQNKRFFEEFKKSYR
ncbi:MAG: histidinol-phosphate transaminase [Proteobacteria bacterium]|nr:MAG: histidinol-phosphate transaminase [Pseudomonadota bacterium]